MFFTQRYFLYFYSKTVAQLEMEVIQPGNDHKGNGLIKLNKSAAFIICFLQQYNLKYNNYLMTQFKNLYATNELSCTGMNKFT